MKLGLLFVTVQLQPPGAVTLTLPVPPVAVKIPVVAERLKLQDWLSGTRHAPRPWVKAKRYFCPLPEFTDNDSVTILPNPVFSGAHDWPPSVEVKTPISVPTKTRLAFSGSTTTQCTGMSGM